jgi:hypothetical protein
MMRSGGLRALEPVLPRQRLAAWAPLAPGIHHLMWDRIIACRFIHNGRGLAFREH